VAPRLRSAFWPVVLLVCVVAAGARSIALGQDANWDLKNYHWYNAYALLNGRLNWDVAPAQIQTYYNPIGDLPFWWLVHTLPDMRAVAFVMAIPAALGAFFLLRTLALLFPVGRERGALVWIAAAAAIGLTGAAGQSTLGSTMNEWPSAALVMAGVWLIVRSPDSTRAQAVAAFLVGCAMGLKLTFAVFGIAFMAACAVSAWKPRRLVASFAALVGGFALFGGYWAWILWREFANPVFPYYNLVFRSPWWEPSAFFDPARGPQTLGQAILLPFYFGLKSTLVMLNHKIGDGITVVKDFDRSLPQIPAHAAELNQVWTNLIDNAVHAMNGSGTLTVRTALDGECVLVEIGDTGPGIPPENLRRVFEPFFTTKPVGEGTGLGLDISYRIVVNRHRGDLSVESRPGDTRFRVRLPTSEESDN